MTDDRVVVDASIVLKWFHQEVDSELALQILHKIEQQEIVAFVPDLLLYEVVNVWMKGMQGDSTEIPAILKALQDLSWTIIAPSTELLLEAAALAHSHKKVSVYDAVYVALAMQKGAYVITADQKLSKQIGEPLTKLLS